MPKVFVTRRIPEIGIRLLQEVCEVEVWHEPLPPSPEVLRVKVADCDGVLALLTDRIDATLLAAAPKLKVVSNYAVGYNNIDIPACTARGVVVGNTPGALTQSTADIAVALMLAAGRRLPDSSADAKAGRWLTWEPLGWLGCDFREKTLGIVGMGRIGFATAERLHGGWGMKVLYTARGPKPDADAKLGAKRVEFAELLRESDFVSVHVDLNDATRGLFNADAFAQMKSTAVFVNTGRGPLVDQTALAHALRTGQIFAAGLDVTDPEPLPPSHELYSLPNCLIVPHIASATVATRDAIAVIAAKNLLAGLRGEPLPHAVNPEAQR
ncbi:MAG: 2-hydroxyacid dehydrogenase [Fimbriiglobus sp.]